MNSTPLNGSVVRLEPRRSPENPTPLRLLSEQIGSLHALCDKLLYRVQQIERREKEMLRSIAALRREITANRKHPREPRATRPASRKAPKPPVELGDPCDSDVPDFGAALSDLNH